MTLRKGMLVVMLFSLLSGCIIGPGSADWILDLPNGYQLSRTNSRSISVYNKDRGERIIDSIIVEYKMNERYIAVKKLDQPEDSRKKLDYDTMKYFLLDMEGDVVYEFQSEDELNDKIISLEIVDFPKWEKVT